MKRLLLATIACSVALSAVSAMAQGVLIVTDQPYRLPRPIIIYPPHPPRPPRRPPSPPPMSYKIKELAVNARIVDQVARVQVTQSFVNTGSRQMEVCFVFPLPHDGAIEGLTFMVDGKEYEGKLLVAKEARKIYEGYVRRNRDPALLEWMGRGMFKTSVFPVPAGAERKVTLRFSQLLRKDRQLTDFAFPLSAAKYTSKPVEKVSIELSIESSAKIKNVYSPTHSVKIKRPDDRRATVKFEAENEVPSSDFRLFFDTAKTKLGASLISYRPDEEDGYFLLLASPAIKSKKPEKLPAKTVVFVVDRSGSMSGKKIDQAKEALRFVLNNLRDDDTFNIIAYDSSVESFRPELERYSDSTRKEAMGFIEGIYAGGSTNIEEALGSALEMVQDEERPSYVIFLTDGKPTAGETNESKIAAIAKRKNKTRTRVISLGVGYDVNSRLLDRLSRDNFGQSEFVRPDEDLETHVSRLYSRISTPVLTSVKVMVDVEGANGKTVNRVYPRDVFDLFQGEQLVLVGRYRDAGEAKVVISGKVGQKKQKFDFPAKLVEHSGNQSYAFVEKLWALRRVGEIIDEMDLNGKNQELIDELVALSTKHGILTPYTSFLADDIGGGRRLATTEESVLRARRLLGRLSETEGRAAFSQRAQKKALKDAELAPQSSNRYARNAPRAPGAAGAEQSGARGGRVFGSGGFGGAGSGGLIRRDIENDEAKVVDTVQIVGNQTLYRRGKLWIAANARDIDLAKDGKKVTVITRFSKEYFKLTEKNTKSENAVLSQQQDGEELLVKLRGTIYHIK